MSNIDDQPQNNEKVDGYKVPGDGNVPNDPPVAGNESFEPNPNEVIHHPDSDIPGKEYNIGDKAYHDSSKEDFSKTISNFNHSTPQKNQHVDLGYKKPDGDR